jgi:GH24 family phage-related lysozyme (muramidase)
MNWYKQQNIKYYLDETMMKEAGFLNNFIIGEIMVLAPLLGYLGWTQTDIFNRLKSNNGDTAALKQQAIEEAQQQDVPEQIIQQVQDNINKPQQEVTEQAPVQKEPTAFDRMRQKLIDNEGFVNKANPIGRKGEIDIGVGHAMLNPNNGKTKAKQTAVSRRIFSKLFGNTVNFDAVLNGRQELTNPQVEQLLKHDIDEHSNRAKRLFKDPNHFNSLPPYLQDAIFDGVYRGDIGTRATPKTLRFMNANDWASAGKEYLNHQGYRKAKKRRLGGVATRMEANQRAMFQYARELGQI